MAVDNITPHRIARCGEPIGGGQTCSLPHRHDGPHEADMADQNHSCCTHWEPLPGGREVCCDCGQEGDVDNPQADGIYEQVVRLRVAMSVIMEAHAKPDEPGASCAEGCGGRWPCSTWCEAEAALKGEEAS